MRSLEAQIATLEPPDRAAIEDAFRRVLPYRAPDIHRGPLN